MTRFFPLNHLVFICKIRVRADLGDPDMSLQPDTNDQILQ